MPNIRWKKPTELPPQRYTCGYCGAEVGSNTGYGASNSPKHRAYICPNCNAISYFNNHHQTPGAPFGKEVDHVPAETASLYREARDCMTVSAYTAAVLTCRKILMHVAVEQGAEKDQGFAFYAEYLVDNHWVPPNASEWLKHIKNKGNEANHEIVLMPKRDAEQLLMLVEQMLRFMYELPNSIIKYDDSSEESDQVPKRSGGEFRSGHPE